MDAITGKKQIPTENKTLADLFYFRRDAKNVRNNLVDSLCYGLEELWML
jgi:hypothetical protein